MADKTLGPLTFGFDIGIASVGWAVLAPDRIVDMGVRAFDAAESKDGKPNNQTRRGARVSRNRYHMRTWRLKRLVRLFRDIDMLSSDEIKHLFSAKHKKNQPPLVSPWTLRAEGLARKLTPKEWAQVIYHIVKHRGFKFFSKTEDPQNSNADVETPSSNKSPEQKEREGLRDGLEYTAKLLKTYPQFKTVGHAAFHLATAQQGNDGIYRDPDGNRLEAQDCEEFQESFRNKGKSYRHAFHRDDLLDELAKVFEAQQQFGNPHVDLTLREEVAPVREVPISSETRPVARTFRDQVFALLELQHPPIYEVQMDALIGDCELESEERNGKGKAERRASKHSFSNERATWLQTINNLRIKRNGREEPLSTEERAALISLPYSQAKVTFKQAREKLREALGFPANWREASFTKVSYRNKRKDDGSWINVVAADGSNTSLGKYGQEDARKKANRKLKERLETGTMTFAELRQLFGLQEGEIFEYLRKEAEIIPASLETTHTIPDSEEVFIKLLPAKKPKSMTLKGKAMKAFSALSSDNPKATLADLRAAIEKVEQLDAGWQFEYNRKDSTPIRLEDEATTQVPIEYEDAQKAEEETLIELKGWHAFKRALETSHPDWWANLQVAWRDPQSNAGEAAAHQIDAIAELLTKAQTDADVENGLTALGLTDSEIKALERTRFKQYRNLSLKALRKILPGLEAGKNRTESCKDAGYESLTCQRSKHLPPLETHLYERIRHGKKTGYEEQRYKDLTNPVVARSFNQARLVLNALIDRYDQSPAYVHVELSRDLAKSKERRDEDKKRQDENRHKRDAARTNFKETYKINEPTEWQILKERLYQEQQGKCVYTLEKLDLDSVIHVENYAQIDHIWPRSVTFDNSLENRVLVHAHANQDKGNRIPYDFIMQAKGAEHWRTVEKWVLSCKGISDNKQKRLLAKELDADEFLARNLVDTRYATRLFARMIRDRLLFDGQVEDRIEDIDPSESGKSRLEKFHKTRVRTPQGGLTAFLRRAWLGDIKNREASDRHHALDACIVAACTPELINKVNSYFANEEKIPNRFQKNTDGTYTDRCNGSGEVISKQEARNRGLFLPPPWEGFRKEFLDKYESVMVSRAVRRKRNGELHDANPLAFRKLSVPLDDLSEAMLTSTSMPKEFRIKHQKILDDLAKTLSSHGGDAKAAFAQPYEIKNHDGSAQRIRSISLPVVGLTELYLATRLKALTKKQKQSALLDDDRRNHQRIPLCNLTLEMLDDSRLGNGYLNRNKKVIDALKARLKHFDGDSRKAFSDGFVVNGSDGKVIRSIRLPMWSDEVAVQAHKTVPLTSLSLDKLDPRRLGATYYHRNRKLIDALRERLNEFGGNAKKAFITEKHKDHETAAENKSKTRKDRPFDPNDYGKAGPMMRSIRLPESCGLGADIRNGIAKLGASQKTEVYWTGTSYFFRNRYGLDDEQVRGISEPPPSSKMLFLLTKNDYVRIILNDGEIKKGYFVFYPEDGRMQVRRHDLPKIIDYVEREAEEPSESDEESGEGIEPANGKKKKKVVLAWRIPGSQIAKISKFKVGVLGDVTLITNLTPHGLA
ncbi:MAG: type II CRISPR RNA-guided endonuclease Cas9 [Sulfuritalea sp.]|nr:type II CRISPR RNA-guided endonuclease Cas9 [Sulfuritalea sp.]